MIFSGPPINGGPGVLEALMIFGLLIFLLQPHRGVFSLMW